ncbi:DUF6164 family protein [Halomonas sp. CUBES01]|uniref:DUF6164 family protein n=1 Tax=Vreelandella gomseomensis TaxID=370766 RepID=A0ABU1GCF6_9GAMM|nr:MULTISPECIES: DUF6164 family protein [Halomonas]MDR5875170.1 DUF6164 family protein [Halomonas gomseomensis]MEC4765967.1 DUF6164 family protein [Halomonas sp. CUBES01]
MAHLLFRLRHVTDEEAMEVRQLLDAHGMDTYETQAGFFRLGVDAIWLRDLSQLETARALLADYQAERQIRARQAHQEAVERGDAPTLWRRFTAHPIQVTLVGVAIVLLIALTLLPFLALG